jgi:transposase
MYSEVGRPSIPPERLLKASLLMALYTVRSERMFCEQLDYNLLFRWFLDLNWDEPGFDHSTFSRNRARLLEHDVAGEFFRTVVAEARELKLTSDEHIWTRPASETACHLDGGNRLQSYIRPIDLGDSA